MSTAPHWVLSLAYWFHMLATVAWLGGLFGLIVLVLPAIRKNLPPETASIVLNQIQSRLQWLGWIALTVLVATGMFQLSSSPHYSGFLAITNSWAVAILIKHIVIFGMVLVSAYLTWGVMPSLNRQMLRRAAGKSVDAAQMEKLERTERRLLVLSLVLSVIVLGLTAFARAV